MTTNSWLMRNLSNEDCKTDLLEYVLIAMVMTLGVIATFATLTARIGMEFSTIASHL